MNNSYPPIKMQTRVRVNIDPKRVAKDWSKEALKSRKDGAVGKVVHYHDGHGLTYVVLHLLDDSIGHYEGHELVVVDNG